MSIYRERVWMDRVVALLGKDFYWHAYGCNHEHRPRKADLSWCQVIYWPVWVNGSERAGNGQINHWFYTKWGALLFCPGYKYKRISNTI